MNNKFNLENIAYLSIDGLDTKDFPDFVDAFAESGEWEDGTEMTEEELDILNYQHHDVVQTYIHDNAVWA